ncbi:MAG TPA: TylF/MycF/NovP-related O-methyltransferase [Polyangia bacterium]
MHRRRTRITNFRTSPDDLGLDPEGVSLEDTRRCSQQIGDKTRKVWVADSFQGLPKPLYKDPYFSGGEMAVSLDEVKQNFRDYGMLDEQVVFLKGFFADTLPKSPIEKLAILRLDGDLYESTMDSLNALYDRVSPGGYIIIDDWNLIPARKAVQDFRASHKITDQILPIDYNGAYWRKS